jgi:hypothetical protein
VPTKNRKPEVQEDLAFQQQDWRAQRVGWGLLGLVILAALAGLLGPGPLSNAVAGGGDRPEVRYERFVRHGGQTELTIRVATPPAGPLRISINRDYLDGVLLEQVLPAPASAQTAGDRLVYSFDRLEVPGPVEVKYVLQPMDVGSHEARISAGNGAAALIRQFTYP